VTKAAKHEEYYDAHQTLNNKYPRKITTNCLSISRRRGCVEIRKTNRKKKRKNCKLENDVTDFHQRSTRLHVAPI
jgi:hypothetical protein